MNKVIAAIDALHFTETQVDGFRYFAGEMNSKLTIVCIDNLISRVVSVAENFSDIYAERFVDISGKDKEILMQQRDENINNLKNLCHKNDICLQVRESVTYPGEDLVTLTRFTDLLMINKSASFAPITDKKPPEFITDILTRAECPILILPDNPGPIKELIFSYNGTHSAVYAIKQFGMLFPHFSNIPVRVIYVAEDNVNFIPFQYPLLEYLNCRYPRIDFEILTGVPAGAFVDRLKDRHDCLVTYGAFGRSRMSRFFHASKIENVLSAATVPIFITHP